MNSCGILGPPLCGQGERDVSDLPNIGCGSAVCKQLNRLPETLSNDRRLRRQFKQAEAERSAAQRARAKARAYEEPQTRFLRADPTLVNPTDGSRGNSGWMPAASILRRLAVTHMRYASISDRL